MKRRGKYYSTIRFKLQNYRTDFDYGTPLNDNTFISLGGFTELETVQEKQALILITEDSSEFLCLKI